MNILCNVSKVYFRSTFFYYSLKYPGTNHADDYFSIFLVGLVSYFTFIIVFVLNKSIFKQHESATEVAPSKVCVHELTTSLAGSLFFTSFKGLKSYCTTRSACAPTCPSES